MPVRIDAERFGPWALITGASSGIGREFARKIAASRINVLLVARRREPLETLGEELSKAYGVKYRVLTTDLSQEGSVAALAKASRDLDVGLVISNAGGGSPGRFIDKTPEELSATLRLSALAHAELALHFGRLMSTRGRGGLVFIGAMGADTGAPFMAHDGGVKAYVQSLGLALREELKPRGVYVTVVAPGPTDTPVLAKFGFDVKTMPMKPLAADRVAQEGLIGLSRNKPIVIPGRLNRIMKTVVPASVVRSMLSKMFEKLPVVSKQQ